MTTVPNIGMNYDAVKISKPQVSSPQSPTSVYQIKQRKQYTIQRKREKWSKEEHRKFMEAIEKFGRNWKKVEEHVKTKTRKQIRSHAQKHFDKMKKMGENFPPPRAKKRAMHPYPSRKTSEMLAMYAKSAQLQHQPQFALQLQSFKREAGEPDPNYERIFGFLTSLFKPSEYPNHQDLLRPLSAVDKKCLRLLMHNLAVILSKEQIQESQQQQQVTTPMPFMHDQSSSPSQEELQQMYNSYNPYMAAYYHPMMAHGQYFDPHMMQYYYPNYFYGAMEEEDDEDDDSMDEEDENDDAEEEVPAPPQPAPKNTCKKPTSKRKTIKEEQ